MVQLTKQSIQQKQQRQQQLQKPHNDHHGLPPILGKIGSIVFFVILFTMANKDKDGYEQFRKCHRNCINGLLHFVGMPMAVSGVFLIVRSVSDSPQFTRVLQTLVTTLYLFLYKQYESNPWSPWLFYILYMSIFDCILYQKLYTNNTYNNNHDWTRLSYLKWGIALIALNVGALETIGHGFYEHHHSYVKEFFNSVFHTPLYGANSVLSFFVPSSDHLCW